MTTQNASIKQPVTLEFCNHTANRTSRIGLPETVQLRVLQYIMRHDLGTTLDVDSRKCLNLGQMDEFS